MGIEGEVFCKSKGRWCLFSLLPSAMGMISNGGGSTVPVQSLNFLGVIGILELHHETLHPRSGS